MNAPFASLVEGTVNKLKTNGIFDQMRRDCLADIDTKPAFQNLEQRVLSHVNNCLDLEVWNPNVNKNQLRSKIRTSLLQSGILNTGIEHILHQVVDTKMQSSFQPNIAQFIQENMESLKKEFEPSKEVEKTEENHEKEETKNEIEDTQKGDQNETEAATEVATTPQTFVKTPKTPEEPSPSPHEIEEAQPALNQNAALQIRSLIESLINPGSIRSNFEDEEKEFDETDPASDEDQNEGHHSVSHTPKTPPSGGIGGCSSSTEDEHVSDPEQMTPCGNTPLSDTASKSGSSGGETPCEDNLEELKEEKIINDDDVINDSSSDERRFENEDSTEVPFNDKDEDEDQYEEAEMEDFGVPRTPPEEIIETIEEVSGSNHSTLHLSEADEGDKVTGEASLETAQPLQVASITTTDRFIGNKSHRQHLESRDRKRRHRKKHKRSRSSNSDESVLVGVVYTSGEASSEDETARFRLRSKHKKKKKHKKKARSQRRIDSSMSPENTMKSNFRRSKSPSRLYSLSPSSSHRSGLQMQYEAVDDKRQRVKVEFIPTSAPIFRDSSSRSSLEVELAGYSGETRFIAAAPYRSSDLASSRRRSPPIPHRPPYHHTAPAPRREYHPHSFYESRPLYDPYIRIRSSPPRGGRYSPPPSRDYRVAPMRYEAPPPTRRFSPPPHHPFLASGNRHLAPPASRAVSNLDSAVNEHPPVTKSSQGSR